MGRALLGQQQELEEQEGEELEQMKLVRAAQEPQQAVLAIPVEVVEEQEFTQRQEMVVLALLLLGIWDHKREQAEQSHLLADTLTIHLQHQEHLWLNIWLILQKY